MSNQDEDRSDDRFGVAFYLALAELSWAMPSTVEAVKQAEAWLEEHPIELPPRLLGSFEDALRGDGAFEINEDLLRALEENELIPEVEIDLEPEQDLPGEDLER